jgi:molybdate transport system substrate-binding protein
MRRLRHLCRLVVAFVGIASLQATVPAQPKPADVPTVAAASDLSAALPELARMFTAATGRTVTLVFGSSGVLAQQIGNGAPFQLFLSADEQYVQRLAADGRTADGGAPYATGRIGIVVPHGVRIATDTSLRGFVAAVREGRITRFAIANPEHAPYGRAAREALMHLGVWQALQPRLVLGENVSQATQFALSGSTQGGIIPLSLARTSQVRSGGTFVPIDASRHAPLHQRMVLIKGAGATARAFFTFLQSPAARRVLVQYGFEVPSS